MLPLPRRVGVRYARTSYSMVERFKSTEQILHYNARLQASLTQRLQIRHQIVNVVVRIFRKQVGMHFSRRVDRIFHFTDRP